MFEVEHLKYATLATVSRCGMIWFSEDVVEPSMVYQNYLSTLSSVPLDADDEDAIDLIGRLLAYVPDKRFKAIEVGCYYCSDLKGCVDYVVCFYVRRVCIPSSKNCD